MARVRSRDTNLERVFRSALHSRGFRFRKHVASLPGTPDVVVPRERVVVFIDGDFWHGYRLPAWEAKLALFWRTKIRSNRLRDTRNLRSLRRAGWTVIRLWQHQIERDIEGCLKRVVGAILDARNNEGRNEGRSLR